MTHLSDFSYVERLVFLVFALVFLVSYAGVHHDAWKEVSWANFERLNLRGLVVVLYTISLVLVVVSDSITIHVKYETGFMDTCSNCTEVSPTESMCVKVPGCAGIVTAPRSSLPDWAHEWLIFADLFWNFGCTLRTTALFLMLTCFNHALPKTLKRTLIQKIEVKSFIVYSGLSVFLYVLLQFVFFEYGSLLSTVAPQVLYCLELLVLIILLTLTAARTKGLSRGLSESQDNRAGIRAALVYLTTLTQVLAGLLFLTCIGLTVINIDILVHTPEVGPVSESKFATDLLTVIFNVGIVFEPIVVVFLLYKPKFRVYTAHSFQGRTGEVSLSAAQNGSSTQISEAQPLVTEETGVLKHALSLHRNEQDKTIVRALSSIRSSEGGRFLAKQTSSELTASSRQSNATVPANPRRASYVGVPNGEQGVSARRRRFTPQLSLSRGANDDQILEEAKAKLLKFEREANKKLSPIHSSRGLSFVDEDEAEENGPSAPLNHSTKREMPEKFWQVSKRMSRLGNRPTSATQDQDQEQGHDQAKAQDVGKENVEDIELSVDDRMALASLWVSDALNNREIKLHRIKGNPVLVYTISHSTTWRYVLYVVMFVQMFALPTMEPAATWNLPANVDEIYPRYVIAVLLDLLCNLFYTADIGLQLYTYGLKELQMFRWRKCSCAEKWTDKSKLMHVRLACWLICMTNIIVALGYRQAFRLDRVLRPANVIFVSTTVLYLMRDLVLTFGDFLGVLLFYLFTIGWYAVVGAFIFDSQQYLAQRNADFGIGPNSTDFQPAALYSVADPAILSLNLFVLSSLESYPDVFIPAYATQPVRSAIFFISFVIFSIIFLQSIAVPLVYLPFQKRQRKRVLEMKVQERKALVAAFEVLDVDGSQKLSMEVMRKLLTAHCSAEHVDLMIQILDEDNDGTVDLFEFFKVVDTIKLNIKVSVMKDERPYWMLGGMRFSKIRTEAALSSVWARLLGHGLCLATLVVLFLYNRISDTIVVATVGLYLTFLVGETILLWVSALQPHTNGFMVKCVCLGAEVVLYVLYFALPLEADRSVIILSILCVLVLTVHIADRLFREVETVAKILFVSLKMVHILTVITVVIFLIMYVYLIIGMESFSNSRLTTLPNGEQDFSTFWLAFLSVFQLETGEAWNELMYAQLVASTNFFWEAYVILYFISFSIILTLYILSIVLAIFLDAFLVFQNVKNDTIQVIYDNDKAVATLGIPKKRYVLVKQRSLEEVLYDDFLQDNHLNTIEELFRLGVISKKTDNVVQYKLAQRKRQQRLATFLSSSSRGELNNGAAFVLHSSTFSDSASKREQEEVQMKDLNEFAELFNT